MDILEKVRKEGLVFDGAMGSILIGKGITGGEASELWNLKHPDIIMEIGVTNFAEPPTLAPPHGVAAARADGQHLP